METKLPKSKKDLNADSLFLTVKSSFKGIKDHRKNKTKITLDDALMSGFALFSLKYPSLLKFDESMRIDENLKSVYLINKAPCDSQMRVMLDEVDPESIYPIYKKLFSQFQRGGELEKFKVLGNYCLLSGDGTGYFSSNTIHCKNCLEKKNKKTGEIKEYHHQFYGLCMVSPKLKEVIPLAPEAIKKQDGDNKNDCERNASKRCLERFRRNHPHLKSILVEDGLASNAPHIKTLNDLNIRYILGAKQGDHKFLFEYVDKEDAKENNESNVIHYEYTDEIGTIHKFRFMNKVSLNSSNKDVKVNFVEYWETKRINKKSDKTKTLHFSWVTDIEVTKDNIFEIMRCGRARWKIENETFNTLKTQDYHFEHNFGHGKKNLSTNMALLMMLAFLIDQIQQSACNLFKAAYEKVGSKIGLWEKVKHIFFDLIVDSMKEILAALAYDFEKMRIKIIYPPGYK